MKNIKYINGALLVALLLSAGNGFAFGLTGLNRGINRVWNMVPSVKPVKKSEVLAGLRSVGSKIPACVVKSPAQLLKIAQKHPYITGAVIAGTAGIYALYKAIKRLSLSQIKDLSSWFNRKKAEEAQQSVEVEMTDIAPLSTVGGQSVE